MSLTLKITKLYLECVHNGQEVDLNLWTRRGKEYFLFTNVNDLSQPREKLRKKSKRKVPRATNLVASGCNSIPLVNFKSQVKYKNLGHSDREFNIRSLFVCTFYLPNYAIYFVCSALLCTTWGFQIANKRDIGSKTNTWPIFNTSVRNGPNLLRHLFQAFIFLNLCWVEQNYTIHL